MTKDIPIQVRTSAKDRAALSALEKMGIGENKSDLLRMGVWELVRKHKVKVPA